MLELGCELVFPVGEGTAVGFLFAMGNFSGFLLGNCLCYFRNDFEHYCARRHKGGDGSRTWILFFYFLDWGFDGVFTERGLEEIKIVIREFSGF